jgi:hypothetical protein
LILLNPFDRMPSVTRETAKMPSQRINPMVFVKRRIANKMLIARIMYPAVLPLMNFPALFIKLNIKFR